MTRIQLALGAILLVSPAAAAQQQLGTKIMGGLGIDAGVQGPPGLYVIDRFITFSASTARDRNGEKLDIPGLDVLVRANAFGAAYSLARTQTFRLTFGASLPLARVSLSSDQPLVAEDRLGVGDIMVQPIKVGWRHARYDVVTSYVVFAPTGQFEPRNGVSIGRGQWTNQFSVGGALFVDSTRAQRASALVSYELNGRKRGIDITRGDLMHVQGGVGTTLARDVVVGIAGYALWQVRDDRGSALPPALAGVRTRTFGLGPEIDITIPKINSRAELRVEWDFGVRARPQGVVISGGLAYRAWAPMK